MFCWIQVKGNCQVTVFHFFLPKNSCLIFAACLAALSRWKITFLAGSLTLRVMFLFSNWVYKLAFTVLCLNHFPYTFCTHASLYQHPPPSMSQSAVCSPLKMCCATSDPVRIHVDLIWPNNLLSILVRLLFMLPFSFFLFFYLYADFEGLLQAVCFQSPQKTHVTSQILTHQFLDAILQVYQIVYSIV